MSDKPKPAYSLIEVDIKDPEAFQTYVKGHQATVAQFGGKFLVANSDLEMIEGHWQPKRIVIHQWPSLEAFKAWYASEAYRPWKEMRHQAAETNVILIEGL